MATKPEKISTDEARIGNGTTFDSGGNRTEKKNGIIAKLTVFFEKYLGLV